MNILVSPDGVMYLRAAAREIVPLPYSRRWLLPAVLGPHPVRWVWMTSCSLAATPMCAWFYFASLGLAGRPLAFATVLLCVMPGVWRCSLRFPILLDAFSFALALVVAALAPQHPIAAVALSLVLGATRESGPVFAALWAWSPWPLVGLLAVGWWRRSAPATEAHLVHPLREAWRVRRVIGLDATLYLRPFGAVLAGVVAPSWQMGATIAVAAAQLFVAVDTVRLLVWCAPVLVGAAAPVIPQAWWVLALVVTLVQRDDRV